MKMNNFFKKRLACHCIALKQQHHLTFSLVPLAPVESALSLPAKSTKLILLT